MTRYPRLLLFLTCLTLWGCEEAAVTSDASDHINAGYGYLDQGQFRAVMIEVQNALAIDQEIEGAHVLQARVMIELGNNRAAYQILERSGGESFEYFDALVRAYLNSRKYASAMFTLRQNESSFQENQAALQNHYGRAYTGLDDAEKANESYQAALGIDPENVEARLGLVTLMAIRGDFISAELQLLDILDTHPDHVNAMMLITGIYLAQSRFQRAEETLTQTIAALPTTDMYTAQRASVIRTLVNLLAQQGRSGEAIIYQRILADAFPQAQENNQKFQEALEKLRDGELEVAERILVDLQESSPGNQTGGALLGVIKYLQGEESAAQSYFDETVDIETVTTPVLKAMALNLFRLNQPLKVVEVLQSAIDKNTTDPQIQAIYGISASTAGLNEEGLRALQRAVDLDPENPRFRLVLAQFFNSLRPPERENALEVLSDGYSLASDNDEITVAYTNQYLLMRMPERGDEVIDAMLESRRGDYDALVIAGGYWLRRQNLDRSMAQFQAAVQLDAEQKGAHFGIGAIELREGRYLEARNAYETVLAIDPTDMNAYRGIMQSYVEGGVPEQGIAVLQEYSESRFDSASRVIVEYHASNDALDDAVEYLRRIERTSPDSYETRELKAEVNYRRAILAAQEGDYARARTSLFEALNAFPLSLRILVKLAQVEVDAGRLNEASKVLAEIRNHHPNSVRIEEITGDIALKGNQFAEATDAYRRYWERSKNDIVALKLLHAMEEAETPVEEIQPLVDEWRNAIPQSQEALLYQARLLEGDDLAIAALYEDYLVRWPDTPAILNNLSMRYIQLGRVSDAVGPAETALSLAPQNPAIMDTLGWALHLVGDSDRSVQLLADALALDPENVEIQKHLETARGEI